MEFRLQANWDGATLYIWGDLPREGAMGPACASADELRARLGELSSDALLASIAAETKLEIALPDSLTLVASALQFGPAPALDLLGSLGPARNGNGVGASLLFWQKLARFVVNFVAARQFAPHLDDTAEGASIANWRLSLQDPAHITWLERAALAMPPVCLAIVGAGNGSQDAGFFIESFLAATTDALIRRCVSDDPFFHRAHERAAEADAAPELLWVSALLGSDRSLRGDELAHLRLAQQVQPWVGRLDRRTSVGSMRLCFTLLEPEDEEEPDIADDADGQKQDSALATAAEAHWQLKLHLQSEDGQVFEADELWSDESRESSIFSRDAQPRRERLLAELARAAEIFPPAASALQRERPWEITLTTPEAHAFMRIYTPPLRDQGFFVLLPNWATLTQTEPSLRMIIRPASGLGDEDELFNLAGASDRAARSAGEISTGRFGLESLLEFDWEIAVGEQKLSADLLRKIARQNVPLIRHRGQWMQIDTDAARQALEFIEKQKTGKMTLAEALRTAYGASRSETGLSVAGLTGTSWLQSLLEQTAPAGIEALPQPEGFNGTLRPYQLRGLHWMAFLDRLGIGGCLADDMGLGKTIQLIALLLHERSAGDIEGPTLLFAPTSVIGNWSREIARFGAKLKVLVHHGPDRLDGEAFLKKARESDVVVTSYSLAHRDVEDFSHVNWRRIALDEAQKIKNPSAASTVAIRSLYAPRRIALTGTPIENHLSELWSIMQILNPGLLGTAADFRERFAVPIEKLGERERAEQLRKLVRPFVLRRLKTDPNIAGDLPEKMEMRVFCNLTPEQAEQYERLVAESLGQIDAAAGIRRRGLILATLTRLKQICNHPALLLKEHDGPLDGRSGKCERLVEMLEEVIEEGDRALVFTQYREMGHLLERLLPKRLDTQVLFLHGGSPTKDRDAMIDEFQTPNSPKKIFLLSLRAGGLGLNLTAANHVFHFDRWWNPAVEAQATDRAHRIGQTRKVQVHKFVCIGTMEERIDRLLTDKLALADRIVGSGDEWLTNLSTDQLREYLTLSREAIGEY